MIQNGMKEEFDGVYRFITRFWKLAVDSIEANVEPTKEMIKLRHQMVHTITRRLEDFSLNTVVSGFNWNLITSLLN